MNQNPVLLLDDVMSELDENRRHAFMEGIPFEVQTFITATTKDYFDSVSLSKADVVDLGSISTKRSESSGDAATSSMYESDTSLSEFKWSSVDMGGL